MSKAVAANHASRASTIAMAIQFHFEANVWKDANVLAVYPNPCNLAHTRAIDYQGSGGAAGYIALANLAVWTSLAAGVSGAYNDDSVFQLRAGTFFDKRWMGKLDSPELECA